MNWKIFFVSFWWCFTNTLSEAALNITPCKRSDNVCINNFGQTLYDATIRGNPELGIETLDPLYQEYVKGNLSIVKYTLKNTSLIGFKDCEIARTILSPDLSNISFEVKCPAFKWAGAYTIDGQLIVIPIQGNGEFRAETSEYRIFLDVELKLTTGNDGRTYVKFSSFKYDGELIGCLDMDLQNLFNGNKQLAEQVRKFIRNNGKPVAKLLQAPFLSANLKKLIGNFNKYLKTLPLDNIILD